jgi:hypothetical protein
MSGQCFSVGEIAIVAMADDEVWQRYVGTECEVIAIGCICGCDADYTVLIDGLLVGAYARYLRKRPGKREPTCTWDDVGVWRPKTEEITA